VGGLQIVGSDRNTIQGLHVTRFSGTGIAISGDAKHNLIGGDRGAGAGPFGQGNMTSHNDFGIGLWSDGVIGASLNTVRGNLVGTDATGTQELGNHGPGIAAIEGAHDNTIGPDNVVAYNGGSGIEVHTSTSLGNTITRNRIHANGAKGIHLREGGNGDLVVPILRDFDLDAGSVKGATCPDCTVEFFSDDGEEGAIYEGWISADSTGSFTYTKGAAFAGPHLTATTTDPAGNTSQFSLPTSGTTCSRNLQQGNDLPITQFRPRQSRELADNRMGAQFDSYGTPEFYDLSLYPRGVKWARTAIAGLEPELVDWDKPEFSIDPSHEDVITRMADNGLTIT
jgi:hypothetical protein